MFDALFHLRTEDSILEGSTLLGQIVLGGKRESLRVRHARAGKDSGKASTLLVPDTNQESAFNYEHRLDVTQCVRQRHQNEMKIWRHDRV